MADFYSLLGLKGKNPTDDELKKAYKKAAMKHHPDKNPKDRDGAEARFKRVAEAYSVLSDPQKKQIYDAYGEEGLKDGGPPCGPQQGGNPFQGGGNPFAGGFPGGGQSFVFQTNGGPGGMSGGMGGIDAHDLFAQLFGGMDMDGGMDGGMGGMFSMGGMPQGRRARKQRKQSKPDEVVHNLYCTLDELYNGTCKKLKITKEMIDAQSGQTMKAQKVLEVGVQKGFKEGTKLTFKGEGDDRPGQAPQNIVFVVKQKPHRYFERKGDDLHYSAALTAAQAAKGVKVSVPTLDGRTLKVEQPAGIKNKQCVTLKGEGMPIRKGGKGDMVVSFIVGGKAASSA